MLPAISIGRQFPFYDARPAGLIMALSPYESAASRSRGSTLPGYHAIAPPRLGNDGHDRRERDAKRGGVGDKFDGRWRDLGRGAVVVMQEVVGQSGETPPQYLDPAAHCLLACTQAPFRTTPSRRTTRRPPRRPPRKRLASRDDSRRPACPRSRRRALVARRRPRRPGPEPAAAPVAGECVVLLHGLGRSEASLR